MVGGTESTFRFERQETERAKIAIKLARERDKESQAAEAW